MDEILDYRVEELSDMLRTSSDTKDSFKSMANVFKEISEYIGEQNKGPVRNFLRTSPCFGSFSVKWNDCAQVMWLQRAINPSLKNYARRWEE